MNYLDRLDLPDQPPLWAVDGAFLKFVAKLHGTSTLHYDFRLELHGRFLAWVLREPPSLNPLRELMAIPVQDHDLAGWCTERRIPRDQGGAGSMLVWDIGHYRPVVSGEASQESAVCEAFRRNVLDFELQGMRLRGKWRIERTGEIWSLRKLPDPFSSEIPPLWESRSVLTGRILEDL